MIFINLQNSASTVNFRTFPSSSKDLCVNLQLLLVPSSIPRDPLIYFLSLTDLLFWTLHIKWIIQFVILCVWLLPFSIMFLRFIRSFWGSACSFSRQIFHCMDNTTFCLSIHCLMGIWVASTLWLKRLWTLVYSFLMGHVLSFLLGRCEGVEFLGHIVNLWLTLKEITKLFSRVVCIYSH